MEVFNGKKFLLFFNAKSGVNPGNFHPRHLKVESTGDYGII
jgi:hypothetical protein